MDHVLPHEYIETLKVLQDKCLARAESEMAELFLEDFGKSPGELFKVFESEPIAAASLAQVKNSLPVIFLLHAYCLCRSTERKRTMGKKWR